MTRHAKEPSARPTERQATRIGRLCLLAIVLFGITASVASAAPPQHPFKETFGSSEQPTFSAPLGLADIQSTGDLLVINKGAGKVERFHADGTPSEFSALSSNAISGLAFSANSGRSQIAVDNSSGATAGNIYVAQSNTKKELKIYAANGEEKTTLTAYKAGEHGEGAETTFANGICGVAVGPEGALYVAEFGLTGQIHKYVPSGGVPGAADNTLNINAENPCLLAAGSGPTAGSLFADINALLTLGKFDTTTGSQSYAAYLGVVSSLGIDPVSGHIYIANAAQRVIVELNASGATEATEVSNTETTSPPLGLAINGATGNIYTTREGNSSVEVLGSTLGYGLTVKVTGEGEVSQTAASAGTTPPLGGSISHCTSAGGPNCSATYAEGAEPELEEIPQPNNHFVEWSASGSPSTTCAGTTSPCKVKLGNESASVEAKFELSGFPLTIEKGGNGSGTVTSTESGLSSQTINCGTHCSEAFSPSTLVHLEASEEVGSQFEGWSTTEGNPGTCTGTTSPCEVTMSEAVKLAATFALEEESFSVNQSGEGTVGCEDNGSAASCSGPFPYGHTIRVVATPEAGWKLEGLTGTGSAAGNCTSSTCEFQITEASEVSASFEALANPATLTLFKSGSGQGTATSLAPNTGISCAASCEEAEITVEEGEAVELEETPAAGSVFGGWIGCRHLSASNRCVTTVGSAQAEVTAIFLATQTITPFTGAKGPCTEGGLEITFEGTTSYVCNGEEGAQGNPGSTGPTGPQGNPGATGPTGPKGPAGATGAAGAQGPQGAGGANGAQGAKGDTGATGPQGPAGANGKVTCKVKGKKVTCTVKYSKASSTQSLRWRLMRGDHAVSHGTTKGALRLDLSNLPSGRYVLHAGDKSTAIVIAARHGHGNGGGAR